MISLGLLLMLIAFLLRIGVLWSLGVLFVLVGLVLWILGALGHAIGGRRHYW